MFPYSKIYGNALSQQECSKLIYLFELYSESHTVRDIPNGAKFTELNLNTDTRLHQTAQAMLKVCANYLDIYRKEFKILDFQFPNKYGLEEMRIKKYLPNDKDEFSSHVDVDDKESAKRMISFLFYLNDVEEGGETVFGHKNEWMIKPKQGNLLMFPPLWTHPHKGNKTISGPKYILTTYINYV